MLRLKKKISISLLAVSALAPITPLWAGSAHADATARVTIALSDAQIAKIVRTANDGEIAQAKLAQKRSTNPAVQDFAKMMIHQHESVNKDLHQVVRDEKIHALSSSDSAALQHDGDATYANLESLNGAAFDKAYADAQVKEHQEVLDSIDNALLPNARDAKLQAMLKKTRPAVQTHLEHAKQLQAALTASAATSPKEG